ncbi:MAG: hypothetical protein K9L30_04765 [Desulfobacterales bacterium]|nr:hypothetical protein [Desulfobacterales bacterium]
MDTTTMTKETNLKQYCSICGRTNIGKQTLCLACNGALGDRITTPKAATSRPRFCTNCGVALDANNCFCTGCGTKI